jgi:uncharacterized protein YndB with AHSA1/START domain
MNFSTQQDIEAPVARVFDALTQFDRYERAAMRRGAEVVRKDGGVDARIGAQWDTRFMLRGKQRQMTVEIVTLEPPTDMVLSLNSRNITGSVRFELFALSKSRTRVAVVTDIRPLTLPAKLFFQSLTLTKATLNKRYRNRIAEFATEIEARAAPEA